MRRLLSTAVSRAPRRKREQYRIASLGEVLAEVAERGDKGGRGLSPVFDELWASVASGTENAESIFHVATLATLCERGYPRQRSMVLRGVERESGAEKPRLRFHCDTRSPKAREIEGVSEKVVSFEPRE